MKHVPYSTRKKCTRSKRNLNWQSQRKSTEDLTQQLSLSPHRINHLMFCCQISSTAVHDNSQFILRKPKFSVDSWWKRRIRTEKKIGETRRKKRKLLKKNSGMYGRKLGKCMVVAKLTKVFQGMKILKKWMQTHNHLVQEMIPWLKLASRMLITCFDTVFVEHRARWGMDVKNKSKNSKSGFPGHKKSLTTDFHCMKKKVYQRVFSA